MAATHNIKVPSLEALIISWPLGENEQHARARRGLGDNFEGLTAPPSPSRVRRHCPVEVDHNFILQSSDPVNIVALSGANEQDVT